MKVMSTRRIEHHIDQDALMDYATGTLAEPMALLVASHVSLCPDCQGHVRAFEAIGGALMEQIAPEQVSDHLLDATLARLGEQMRPAAAARAPDIILPTPLHAYLGRDVDQIRWRKLGPGLSEALLPVGNGGYKTSLMRVRAGSRMPVHTHRGNETVLVLAGGFSDEAGHYGRGDVASADKSRTHRPVADEGEDCICLAVVQGGLRLTGPVGRWLNLFVRD
jgi:putative transcriptional regulator